MERWEERKTYFAKTNYRGKEKIFGIKALDRLKHVYVIGKTGMGKSVTLENMAIQDIQNGNGLAFLDPHGSSAEKLLEHVPEERIHDVLYIAPFDLEYPVSFNVMEDVGYDKRHLVVSNLMSAFKKIWVDAWSARMEYILQNALLALLEYPGSTLLSVNRMLIDKDFRKDVVSHVTDPIVKSFWVDEFAKYTDTYTREATPAIQNKVGQFVSNPVIRNIIGQPKSSFDIREMMDKRKILILNLSKGRMGETNARLLGSMLIIKLYLGAMSRADCTASELAKLPPFFLFVDEFQSFANETFADILSEARKYKLSLTIAHQYVGQMEDEVRDAIFGNVGTLITFRIGAEDAEMLEKEFSPTFTAEDIVGTGAYNIYLKLMIDGLASRPFSALTLPPIEKPKRSFVPEVLRHSRRAYAKPRSEVEEAIRKSLEPVPPPPKPIGEKSAIMPKVGVVERKDVRPITPQSSGERKEWRKDERPRERVGERPVPSKVEGKIPEQRVAAPIPPVPSVPSTPPIPPAPPIGHSSFKDALAAVRQNPPSPATPPRNANPSTSEAQKIEPVSLNVLRKNSTDNTGKLKENLSQLKRALDAAMEEKTPGKNAGVVVAPSRVEAGIPNVPRTGEGAPTEVTIASTPPPASPSSVPPSPPPSTPPPQVKREEVKREEQVPKVASGAEPIPEIPENELREILRIETK
ncbi:MAG: type IV secretion system DNA-binding domain-containing protein [Parcubacteria group bacterium]|nr:type IV secretion system DNA-binding domain-containing protein [Parcubacteria group bacterium]